MTRRRDVDKLQEEIEELFADLWQVPRFAAGLRRGFRPNVDCYHTDDPHELTVIVDLPGIDASSVKLIAGERTLLITGERTRPKVDGRIYQQVEIEYGPFQRQVRLPEDVDAEGAHARYDRGLLTVSLPIGEKPAPRGRVTIEVERG